MSEQTATYFKKATVSPLCLGMWPGMQDATDGRTQILDISGNGRHLSIGAGDTYGAVTATGGYATINGTTQPTDKSLATPSAPQWDMALEQSIIIAYTIKAAAPGANGQVFNARGASGNTSGVSQLVNLNGQPQIQVRDGTTTYTSTLSTGTNLCDNAPHVVVVYIDGTGKKAYGWMDGAVWSHLPTGEAITASAGSTQADGPLRWGAAGDFAVASLGTWVATKTLGLRRMHAYVMPYAPANMAAIVDELTRNPHRPLSARMLPATASD